MPNWSRSCLPSAVARRAEEVLKSSPILRRYPATCRCLKPAAMPDSTLDKLMQQQKPLSVGLPGFLKKIKQPKPQKSAFSVPKMKQVAKLAEGMGKQVTGFTVNGDGGFTITAVEPCTFTDSEPNPFDVVLPK